MITGTPRAPRILYIAPAQPYPLNTGMARRGFHLLRGYASVGVTRMVCFGDEGESQEELRQYCEDIHTIPKSAISRRTHGSGWRARLEMMGTLDPTLVSRFESPQMGAIVERLADWPDLVHVAKLWMVPNVARLLHRKRPLAATILDLDDVETVVQRRALTANRADRWHRRAFERYDLIRLWWYQRRALQTFDRVFVCSDQDRQQLGQKNVLVIPNGATVPDSPLPDDTDDRTLLYTCNLSYQPNVDGLLFLVNDVLPLVRREIPDVSLLVAGSGPSQQVLDLQRDPRIQVVGSPPSLEPFYRQATVAVVSLRVGGGTRLRILEALALGRPVVSTSIGCEGLSVTAGEHLLVADDAEGLARSCVTLLRDRPLRRRLAAQGRELVKQQYSWGSIEERVRACARSVLERNPV